MRFDLPLLGPKRDSFVTMESPLVADFSNLVLDERAVPCRPVLGEPDERLQRI